MLDDQDNSSMNCCGNILRYVSWHQALFKTATRLLMLFFVFGTLWGLLGNDVLPGSEIFAFIALFLCSYIGGIIVTVVKLPSLLGMLVAGFLFRNLTFIPYYNNISMKWAIAFRNGALVVILLRAGLGLDPTVLKKMSVVCLRLAFIPCLVEAVTVAIASHLVLGLPWSMGFCLGFVLAAVSPAIVLPSMLNLGYKGFGNDKGIATLLIAASSIDDVLAIAGFGLSIGIAYSTGNLVWAVVKGPAEVLVGLAYGGVVGVVLWYLPYRQEQRTILYRTVLLLFSGLGGMYVSHAFSFAASGALGCLTVAFVVALKWRTEEDNNATIEDIIDVCWQILQPFLFGLVGAEVLLQELTGQNIGFGLLVFVIGIILRLIGSYCSLYGSELNRKEKAFVAVAWLPKATVQVAIGSVALDFARSQHLGEVYITYGKQILSIAVLSILITAPLGAIGIATLGPILLKKSQLIEEINRCQEIECDLCENTLVPNKDVADEYV